MPRLAGIINSKFNKTLSMSPDYYIGLPQWKHPQWDQSFQTDLHQSDLSQYAACFNSVEGNTTFYGLPGFETLQRWRQETPSSFRFCFKFPQTITHMARLRDCETELRLFLDAMLSLEERLGMLCLQLPGSFGPDDLVPLEQFLQQLPAGLRYGVEVRHPVFFQGGDAERRFNRLLMETGINRIAFDTRALFAHPAQDAVSREALQQKPRLPLRVLATGTAPMVRFITPLSLEQGYAWLEPWVGQVLKWIDEGRTPFMFMHTPDNRQAPELARWFAQRLQQQRPGIKGFVDWAHLPRRQPGLF